MSNNNKNNKYLLNSDLQSKFEVHQLMYIITTQYILPVLQIFTVNHMVLPIGILGNNSHFTFNITLSYEQDILLSELVSLTLL